MIFREIFRFEIWYQLRRPSTWIFFLALTGLNFMVIGDLADSVRSVENQLFTAPIIIAQFSAYSGNIGLLLIAALAGDGAMRDINVRIDPLIYTTPISKPAYLGGRFLGTACLSAGLIIIAGWLSLWLAACTNTIDAESIGPFIPSAYLQAALFIALPNVIIATAAMYTSALLSRQAMAAYLGALLIVILSTFSMELSGNNREVARLIDPSGIVILEAYGKTLTPQNMNTEELSVSTPLFGNRILWLAISVITAIFTFRQFRFSNRRDRRKNKAAALADEDLRGKINPLAAMSEPVRSFDLRARIYQVRALSWSFFMEFLKSPMVLILPVIGIYAFILIPNISAGPMMVPILPTTGRMNFFLNHSALQIILVIPVSFLAGQLVWRERDSRSSEISDALPVPNAVIILSKYAGLILILLSIQLTLLLAAMALQASQGYYAFEIAAYLRELFVFQLAEHLAIAAAIVFIHVLINQKYVAHLVVFIFYLYTAIPRRFGIEHKLLIFNSDSGLAHSAFYDQSAFLPGWILFKLYWIAWGILLLIAATHLLPRGRELNYSRRLSQSWTGLKTSRLSRLALALLISTGGLVFYNTNILHDYVTRKEKIAAQASYERQYAQYKQVPQPYHTATKLNIEIYPREQEAVISGNYLLKNGGKTEMDSIHIVPAPEVSTSGIRFNRTASLLLNDKKQGYLIYLLEEPLRPGELLQMNFTVRYKQSGFSNEGIKTDVLPNGSYFGSSDWLPAIGYQQSREITDAAAREDHGLPKLQPALSIAQDPAARYDRSGLEKISFEATIGTAAGQLALAPGSLKRTWSENGRRYAHYVSEKPIRNAYHIYSADYRVRNSSWQSTELNIFHHPASKLNLGQIGKAMSASLDYYSRNFSPYEFSELRMVEYADPGTGGISLPGSIGYSTNFALLNTANDVRGFDLPFAVTAHEIAHQWWPHQLGAARVAGRALITESLAWYSALGVVEQTYGSQHLRNLLDAMRTAYLAPRSRAGVPLLESADSFDAYRRGPFAMYALREYIGEEQMNMALRKLLYKFRSGEPPYATSQDLYSEVRAVTPDSLQYLLKDLFETNTFWDLAARRAAARKTNKGNWQLTLDVTAKKSKVDPAGAETALPMNDLIEIGVFAHGKEGRRTPLYLKKHRIRTGSNRIIINVAARPAEAGIDPRHLLVDTDMVDNVGEVK